MTLDRTMKTAMTLAPAALVPMAGAAYAQSADSESWMQQDSDSFWEGYSKPLWMNESELGVSGRTLDIQFVDEERDRTQIDANVHLPLSIGPRQGTGDETYLDLRLPLSVVPQMDADRNAYRFSPSLGLSHMVAGDAVGAFLGVSLGATAHDLPYSRGTALRLGVQAGAFGREDMAGNALLLDFGAEFADAYRRLDFSARMRAEHPDWFATPELEFNATTVEMPSRQVSEQELELSLPVELGSYGGGINSVVLTPSVGFTVESMRFAGRPAEEQFYGFAGMELAVDQEGNLPFALGVRYDPRSEATFYLRFGD